MENIISTEDIIVEKPYLKVACILDNFSYNCFKYECNLIQLNKTNWIKILLYEKIDLLLVESVWTGVDGTWTNEIYNINSKKRSTLKNTVELCKKLRIPTVFWNKEDPYHFNEFIETAKLFEYVFTTDQHSIPKYKKILQHNNIYLLPFAAQPKIHNPIINDLKKIGKVAFAGSWYNIQHFTRKKNMEYILQPAFKYNLDIYDRNYICCNENYHFPKIYRPFIKGYIPYKKINEIYKKYYIFLNVNSINNSPTMFSRRIFELLACGTNVISSYSLGIKNFFPRIVKLSKTKYETLVYLDVLLNNKNFRDKLSLLGQREVFKYHTYKLRLEAILDKIGIKCPKQIDPGVCIITCVNKHTDIQWVFENYERQTYQYKELIIILNNKNINLDLWKEEAKNHINVKIFYLNKTMSFKKCLEYGIENTNLEYVAVFNYTDYYAPNYILDMMTVFKYADTDIICKYSYFSYLKHMKLLILIHPYIENKYVKSITTSTMIIRKNIFNKLLFSEDLYNENINFLPKCISKNLCIYSTNRFNYVCINSLTSNKNHKCKINEKQYFQKIKPIKYTDDYIDYISI